MVAIKSDPGHTAAVGEAIVCEAHKLLASSFIIEQKPLGGDKNNRRTAIVRCSLVAASLGELGR